MAHTKSAIKRNRQSIKNRARNIKARGEMKVARKSFLEALAKKDEAASKKAFSAYCSVLDKSAKRGIIKKNNAVRKKGRAADALRAALKPAA